MTWPDLCLLQTVLKLRRNAGEHRSSTFFPRENGFPPLLGDTEGKLIVSSVAWTFLSPFHAIMLVKKLSPEARFYG